VYKRQATQVVPFEKVTPAAGDCVRLCFFRCRP